MGQYWLVFCRIHPIEKWRTVDLEDRGDRIIRLERKIPMLFSQRDMDGQRSASQAHSKVEHADIRGSLADARTYFASLILLVAGLSGEADLSIRTEGDFFPRMVAPQKATFSRRQAHVVGLLSSAQRVISMAIGKC